AILGGVLRQLVGDALQRLLALQDRDGDVEVAQIILERLRIVHPHELGELLCGLPWQSYAVAAREVEQRLGADRAIEMTVQLRFRQLTQLVGENREWHYKELKSESSPAAWRARTMRNIAPLCTGVPLSVTIPRLSVISL